MFVCVIQAWIFFLLGIRIVWLHSKCFMHIVCNFTHLKRCLKYYRFYRCKAKNKKTLHYKSQTFLCCRKSNSYFFLQVLYYFCFVVYAFVLSMILTIWVTCVLKEGLFITSPPGDVRSIMMSSVFLFVCPLAHLENHMFVFHEILSTSNVYFWTYMAVARFSPAS